MFRPAIRLAVRREGTYCDYDDVDGTQRRHATSVRDSWSHNTLFICMLGQVSICSCLHYIPIGVRVHIKGCAPSFEMPLSRERGVADDGMAPLRATELQR